MGKQALRIFDEAERLGGLRAKIALAVETRVSSTEATGTPDTPELLQRLQAGLTRVRAMDTTSSPSPGPRTESLTVASPLPRPTSSEESLRRQQRTYLDLMTQRSLLLGDVESATRRITEGAAAALEVERVSVWYVQDGAKKIVCADLYERAAQTHSSGRQVLASDCGPYFAALGLERTIAAHDAHTDPRTACLSEPYLRALGIGAMLDVPIWVAGAMVGVVCHEHVGGPRTWTADEETFAYLMASFVGLAMESTGRARP